MDLDTILYIAAFVGVMIFNAMRASAKKKQQQAKAAPKPQPKPSNEPSVEDIIQEILGQRKQEQTAPQPDPYRHSPLEPEAGSLESIPEPATNPYQSKWEDRNRSMETNVPRYEALEITEMGHEGEHSVEISEFEPDHLQRKRPVFDRSKLNLRDAIVMETILNRPYQ